MNKFVFLGPPGVGKGTLAEIFCDNLALAHISTGDILRAEIASGSTIGQEAKGFMDGGNLVPDEIVATMVANCISQEKIQKSGFILDGFPRTESQAKLLNASLDENNLKLDAVISLEAEDELLYERLTARRICKDCKAVFNVIFKAPTKEGVCDKCSGELYQRTDDNLTTAKERLAVYKSQTEPLIAYYKEQGILLAVDGSREKSDIFLDMTSADGILAK